MLPGRTEVGISLVKITLKHIKRDWSIQGLYFGETYPLRDQTTKYRTAKFDHDIVAMSGLRGDTRMKRTGMLVVPFRGKKRGFANS